MGIEDSYVSKLMGAAKNPAAPSGLQQTAEAAAGYRQDKQGPFADSYVGQLIGGDPEASMAGDAAQSWYGGANVEGTTNGWSTDFMATAFRQQEAYTEKAYAEQDATSFYDWLDPVKNPTATGVATWNDATRGIKAGDVYENGQKVANLYDQFDEYTADVMLAEFKLDAKTKQQIFASDDRESRMREEVGKFVEADTATLTNTLSQADFNEDVQDRQDKLQAGLGDEALMGGSALATGAMGAGIGAVGGPVGAAVGFGVGFGAGLLGGWLNQDQLTEQTARAAEVVERANSRYGGGAGFTTAVQEYSGVGLRMIAPASNIVQGLYDATSEGGRLGDGRSEFYEMDEDGNRKRPMWLQVADIGATVVDSVTQFSSGVGIAAYMGGTGAHVAGKVGTMAQTGAGFNDRTGDFDDYEGAGEWASAIGAVGIDAVQFGMAGAIARGGAAARAAITGEAATGRSVTLNGRTFKLDDAGNVTGSRFDVTMLAPSESLRWVATSWKARTMREVGSGKPGHDDFYRAALSMAGGNRFSNALVNGWAEGSEEAVQAMLEPMSFSEDINWGQVVESYFYGMGAGVGMSLGQVSRPPTNDQVASYRAKALYMKRNANPELTDEEWADIWKGMSDTQRQKAATATPEEAAEVAESLQMFEELHTIDRSRKSTIGAMAEMDMRKSAAARDLANINPAVDGSLVMRGQASNYIIAPDGRVEAEEFAPNTGNATAWQTVANIAKIYDGLRVQATDVKNRLATAESDLAAATESGDADQIARAQQVLDQVSAEAADTDGLLKVSDLIRNRMLEMYEELRALDPADVSGMDRGIAEMNAYLRDAFHGELKDEDGTVLAGRVQEFAKRAVELKVGRHPFIDSGSFLILMPQVSKALTLADAHGTLYGHQATLKAMGGDYDGDFQVSLNTTYLPQAELDAIRMGTRYLAPTETGKEVIVDPPDGEKEFVDMLADGFDLDRKNPMHVAAVGEMTDLVSDFYERYSGVVPDEALVKALEDFRTNVSLRDYDARVKLANALFNAAEQPLLQMAKDTSVPELLWMMSRISRAWDSYQKTWAAHAADMEFTPATVTARMPKDRRFQVDLAAQEAATDGQTIAMLLPGADPVRDAQHLHYSALYRAAVDTLNLGEGGYVTEAVQELVELFANLGSQMTQSELDQVRGRNAIEKRVVFWLKKMAEAAKSNLPADASPSDALLLIANTRVADITVHGPNDYTVAPGEISMLQLLLKKSLEIEENAQRKADPESDIMRKIRTLKRLTERESKHSVTASLATMEVFGHVQLHELLGDSAKYLGPQLTLNQLKATLTNVSEETRNKIVYRWRRRAPYALHAKIGDPPYSAQAAAAGELSSYKILVDAVVAAVHREPTRLERKNDAAEKDLVNGLTWVRQMVTDYRKLHSKRLGKNTDDLAVLRDMLDKNRSLAEAIAGIIPDASKAGAFEIHEGAVYAAPWVEQMLVEPDAGKAAVSYLVNSKFAEWNAMGGNIDERDIDPETGEPKPNTHPRSYGKLKSRFLQTMYHLAQQPDGFEFDRFILAARSAPNPTALFEQINSEPMWRGDRAKLLPFVDDVAEFEADPSEIWSANLPGALQREALRTFAGRAEILSRTMAESATQYKSEQVLLNDIETYLTTDKNRRNAKTYAGLLKAAITNRQIFPDATGRGAREQLIAILQSGVIRMQDKGKADPAVAPFGEPLITMDEFGVKQSVFQELDALTSLDPEDIQTNLTKLVDGPVRIGLEDGSTVLVDLSTVEGALAALKDPATNGFAKAVLFPTVRDIDNNNVVQKYMDVRAPSGQQPGLKSMLEEQTFKHLFPESGKPTVEQAYRYIGTIEAGVRKAALTGTDLERDQAFFPIQQIINEALVAYTHRPGSETVDKKKVRDELVVDVAHALMSMATLAGRPQMEEVRATLKAVLRERFLRDSSALAQLLDNNFEAAAVDIQLSDATASAYMRSAAKIAAQLADPNLTDAERAELEAQQDRLGERVEAYLKRLEPLKTDDVVTSVINMFTMTGDPAADLERKAAIQRILGAANRLGKFQGNYRLIDKVQALLAFDPQNAFDEKKISPEEWDELAAWASTVYLAEMGGRSGSTVTLTPLILGKDGEQQRRYFDVTWGYLIDGLLNDQVLNMAKVVATQAGYVPDLDPSKVAGVLERGLLNEKKLGPWTPMVVPESLKARRVLSTASVGLAVPVAGDDPKELADYVGAGWNLFEKPVPAEHHTTETLPVDVFGGTAVATFSPTQLLRINNHFASKLTLHGIAKADGRTIEIDLMPEVGRAWMGHESVETSGYLVVNLDRIQKAIAKHAGAEELLSAELEIEYVDVDKKPFTRDYANSVYFDGIGRDSEASTGPGPVAELVFAPGALSKTGQQNPLDMATKGGAAYQAIPTSSLDTVVALESTSTSVADVLAAKALHMLGKRYDTGFLLTDDITALYKLMKQRHVVVGTNAEGEKEVWWAERAIAAQAGAEPMLTDPKLVALTDSQAQTLLGKAGSKGLRGVATMPVFNLRDVDPFPSTDNERLATLGLTRLGEESTLADTPFAGMTTHALAMWSPERGQSGRTRHQEQVQRWRGEQLKIRVQRTQVAKAGEQNFDIPRINEQNGQVLESMLGIEALAPVFARLKIPFPDLRDMGELSVSQHLLTKLKEAVKANPSTVIWQHVQDASSDPAQGVLGKAALDGDFENLGAIPPPTFEDFVIVDMAAMERANGGVMEKAYEQGKAVIRQYAQRGVTVVLAAEDGGHELRNYLAAWLRQESLGYRQMAESAHFFAPINDDYRVNKTQQALESTLTMVQQVEPRGLIARVLSDAFGTGSSENTVYQDLRPDTPIWQRVAITLLPTQITGTAGGRKYTYGIPVAGTGQLDQRGQVKAALLPLLRSEEGRKHLKRIGGGDPEGVAVYRENENGTIDPGILSFDDALDELEHYLEANEWMLENGRTLMVGSIIPTLATDGTILLTRVGFQLPDVIELGTQLKTAIGQDKPKEGEKGAGVAIAPAKLQANWTVPPPFTIDKIEGDARVGIAIEGTYDLTTLSKQILEGDGFKNGLAPMPNHLAFPDEPLAPNGFRVTQAGSRKAVESKAAVTGQVTDFRWAFLLSGIDFRDDMVNFFLGRRDRSEKQFEKDWATVNTFLTEWARRKPGLQASEIAAMLDEGTYLGYAGAELNKLAGEVFGKGFTVPVQDAAGAAQQDATERLAVVMLAALQAPRVKLEHVISTPGLMTVEDLDGDSQMTLMPPIFTDALNDTSFPELRNMILDRVNARMPREADGTPIYWLGRDLKFRIRMQNPETGRAELMPTTLQISLGLPAAENPAGYVQSSIRSERQGETQHVSFVFAETTGGRIALEREMRNVNRLFSGEGIARFGELEDGGFWSLLNSVPSAEADSSYAPWRKTLPMQKLYLQDASRKVGQYTQPIDKDEDSGWKGKDVLRAQAKADELAVEWNLTGGEAFLDEADYLVRQFFGRPAATYDQDPEVGRISPQLYMQAMDLILANVRKHMMPTYGGIVPLPHETLLEMIYEAQAGKAKPWAPLLKDGRRPKLAESWDQWVYAAFGQMLESNTEFHSMYRMDLDGFLHTYQGTGSAFETMSLSTDQEFNKKLMDKGINEFLLSLDPNEEVLLADPVLFETQSATLDALVGYQPTVDAASARTVETSDLAKQVERQAEWLRTKRLAPQKKTRMKDYLEEGVRYQESSRDTHNFFHGMVNLSIAMRLANPALFASAFIEVPVRNSMEHATNLLTGSYTGKGGKTIARVGKAVGMDTRFTPDQIDQFRALAEQMGESNRWLATVYDELMYQGLVESGGTKTLGNFLQKAASAAAKSTSDPRWGMLASSIAKRYLEAAWEFISVSDTAMSLEQFMAEMSKDPLWLQKNYRSDVFNPHQAGLNRVAQVRSVKGTVTSKILMGAIDNMTRSTHSSVNAAGHLLKIPFLFTRFNANALTTMTGLGGLDQLAAMFLDRRENALLGRMKAAMVGREYNPAEHDAIDMSDVLEGIDLTRPFIRGAVTHTGLMALGMMAGSLGLSGEDDEARRRRRLATYLGTPHYLDPREAQNDFLYADAIFLDSIPGLNMIFRDESGRSPVVPHWIMRQFMSPVMGMERFFATGDARQIGWGFADAFSVIPTSVTRLWREADMTADMLLEAAQEEGSVDVPEKRSKVSQFLINTVGVYEKALLESSFVNAIRNGTDKYNRNPWFLAEVKDDGTIVRDRMGNPQRTQGLSTFVDDNGTPNNPNDDVVRQGYTNRGDTDAMIHQYAENNATAAMLMSLFTGQWSSDSSYLRQNMVPSQKIVNLGPADKIKAEALLYSAYVATGGQPMMTLDEIERKLKARDERAGKWWEQEEITAEAQAIYAASSDKMGALSLLDPEAGEVITKAGAKGIYKSVQAGLMELGDASLRGVYIPPEMRDEIAAEWSQELIQEGMTLGLDETAAKYRAKRIWYGNTFEDPEAIGLRDIIYSDKIPLNGKVKYNQLNTTYMIGPDGKPWATPFQRTNVMQSLGIPWPHTSHTSTSGLGKDQRGKVVDEVVGINTGLHALERVEDSWKIEPNDEAFEDVFNKPFTPNGEGDDGSGGKYTPWKKWGYTPWKRKGYSSGGYSRSYGGGGYFSRMYALPRASAPYGNNVSFVNTSNPILRRAFIRRERISSERGRLKQWQ